MLINEEQTDEWGVTYSNNGRVLKCVAKSLFTCEEYTIPEGVEVMEHNSFYGQTYLKRIHLPNTLREMGNNAFIHCPIESIEIPSGITKISASMCECCRELKEVRLPSTISGIQIGAFNGCDKGEKHKQKDYYYFKSMVSHRNWIMKFMQLSILFQKKDYFCILKNEIIMSYTDKYGVKYSDDGKTLEYCPKDFKGKYEIPYGVTTIGVPSFLRYDLDNLDKWNDDAFANCHGLTEIVIPNSVIEINREAFSNCTSLKEIRIPDCTFVEEKAFEGCSNINKIYCSQMSEVFLELPSVKEIHTSNLTMQITKKNWYLKEIFLSDDYYPTWNFRAGNFVEEFLFRNGFGKMNCQSLDKIEVPPMNTQLDSRGGCNAVIETSTNTLLFGCNHTIIPDTVTTISAYAFLDSKKLKTIHVPESVTTIGDYAFKGCYNLCEIQLPESILAIGENAFPHGKALKRIVVPKGKRKHFLKIGLKNYADLVVEE